MNWLDGQERRAWLDRQDARLANALSYYAGPAAKPLNALAKVGAMLNPAQDVVDMADGSRELMQGNALSGLAGIGGGALGMFLGPAARIADRGAMEVAQRLADQGADARRIWDETGWFQGADDKWRFEIDDSGTELDVAQIPRTPESGGFSVANEYIYKNYPEFKDVKAPTSSARVPDEVKRAAYAYMREHKPETQFGALSSAFQHPELSSAYDTSVIGLGTNRNLPVQGVYETDQDRITLGGGVIGARDDRSTLLHELQHSVQEREGFARGSSGSGVNLAPYRDEIMQLALKESRDNGTPLGDAMARIELEYQSKLYNRTAGEVEARNVQTRRDWPMEQRRATPPWETEDVPRDQQIVRFR